MNDHELTDEVNRALTAAAARLEIQDRPAPARSSSRPRAESVPKARPSRPPHRTRWWPAVAAAAVVAILLGAIAFWLPRTHDTASAATLTRSGDVADLGGIRFLLPHGWSVAVTSSADNVVVACIAAQSSSPCRGVQLTVAVPDRRGHSAPLRDESSFFTQKCSDGLGHETSKIIMIDDHPPISVAGRPGVHYWSHCGDSTVTEHLWQLDDLTFMVYAPAEAAEQGIDIMAGMDLTHWRHSPGAPVAFFSGSPSAPSAS